jgi:hypothetical protein
MTKSPFPFCNIKMNENKSNMLFCDENDKYANAIHPIPSWFYDACESDQDRNEAKQFYTVETAKNGRCLFHSVRICLHSVMINPDMPPYTCEELLTCVTDTFLDDEDTRAQSVLLEWYNIFKGITDAKDTRLKQLQDKYSLMHIGILALNASVIEEHGHVRDILCCKNHYTDSIIKVILENIMNRGRCEQALIFWKMQVQDEIMKEYKELGQDYEHVKALLAYTPNEKGIFSLEARRAFVKSIEDPKVFWGEEYAVSVMERKLKVKFLILKSGHVMESVNNMERSSKFALNNKIDVDNNETIINNDKKSNNQSVDNGNTSIATTDSTSHINANTISSNTFTTTTSSNTFTTIIPETIGTSELAIGNTLSSTNESQSVDNTVSMPSNGNTIMVPKLRLMGQVSMSNHQFKPNCYFILYLSGQHYQPLVRKITTRNGYKYTAAFRRENIPAMVRLAFKNQDMSWLNNACSE